jgi:dihydrofolate reductase
MRKFIVISMISMDGVMQAPGGPEEDTSGDFKYGGWSAPYGDADSSELMRKLMQPSDLLLGRRTFEIWENYWPVHEAGWPGINEVKKYVVSSTRKASSWNGAAFLKDIADIQNLRSGEGPAIQIWGSRKLIQTLLSNDLVDEIWMIIYPLTLGNGKQLFEDGSIPAAFSLVESKVTSGGLIFAHYVRGGEVVTGRAGE